MGLDCSHDAFHGAYSSFNRLRQSVAAAAGGSFPEHEDPSLDPNMWYVGARYRQSEWPGLALFLNHSDCDGDISAAECAAVARELNCLVPGVPVGGVGHLARLGGTRDTLRQFIAGCWLAHARGERLEFC